MRNYTFALLSLIVIISGCIKEEFMLDIATPCYEESVRSHLTKSSTSGDVYYWSNGEKIYLNIVEDKYFCIFDAMAIEANAIPMSNLASYDLIPYSPYIETTAYTDDTTENYYSACVDSTILSSYNDAVIYSAPYLSNGVSEVGITNTFYIKLKSESDVDVLYAFAEEHNSTVICENFLPLWNTLSCSNQSTYNALELANIAYESGLFAASDVELYGDVQVDVSYNDEYYNSQWNLFGTYGINLGTTHDITMGNPSVIVSIVDNCIQLDHPDLVVTNSYDATSQTSPGRLYYDPDTNELESHGTSMTGIIAATTNNNIGIVGIAPNASILPISVDFSNASSQGLAHAVRYAADNGVRVISNSWSGGGAHQARDEAFQYALNKGCILVQSSGNLNSTTPRYPYCLYPEVIVTGNSNSSGNRHVNPNKPSSGSNYNSHLDIMAPGTNIQTLNSSSGYNSSTGTSPACAHVSATAALMLSVNQDLTRQQVTEIIASTAKKLPAYEFEVTEGRPNGTWNEEVGYGLVNAFEAVCLAKGYYNLMSFDYSGEDISFSITADKDIAVIWDWETEDITEVEISSSTTHTFTHTFSTAETRRIYIAEMIDFETDEVPLSSTAVTGFNLTTGNYASNFEFKPINEALTDIQIIGGFNFESQDMIFSQLPALESLYLINVPNADVTLDNCPELTVFSTSRFIWYDWSEIKTPYVIGPVYAWPTYPESVTSLMSLEINDCPSIHTLSLENVGLTHLSFEGLPQLEYVYLSSQSSKIVGKTDNYFSTEGAGAFLKDAINTLPAVTGITPGILIIRCVADNNLSFIPVSIGSGHLNTINTVAEERNWDIIWD